ncbi:hypothetical protein VAEKB19_3520078 [Vibrio aestuarianus]|nr:hypothetical protein VAEKB19_3520078 [Vibrio aestuarianus]
MVISELNLYWEKTNKNNALNKIRSWHANRIIRIDTFSFLLGFYKSL